MHNKLIDAGTLDVDDVLTVVSVLDLIIQTAMPLAERSR